MKGLSICNRTCMQTTISSNPRFSIPLCFPKHSRLKACPCGPFEWMFNWFLCERNSANSCKVFSFVPHVVVSDYLREKDRCWATLSIRFNGNAFLFLTLQEKENPRWSLLLPSCSWSTSISCLFMSVSSTLWWRRLSSWDALWVSISRAICHKKKGLPFLTMDTLKSCCFGEMSFTEIWVS